MIYATNHTVRVAKSSGQVLAAGFPVILRNPACKYYFKTTDNFQLYAF